MGTPTIKLAVFDVDGTLLRGNTACQTIARAIGKYERMCELERQSGREAVLSAREEMASWYLQAGKPVVEEALENLHYAPGAADGIESLKQAGVALALASVTWSFAVDRVAEELGIEHTSSSYLDFETGAIRHTWASTKAEYLQKLAARFGLEPAEIAAIGDSSGDFEMFRVAGLPIYVGESTSGLHHGVVHMLDADIRDVADAILEHKRAGS